jgi:hypothetical protein
MWSFSHNTWFCINTNKEREMKKRKPYKDPNIELMNSIHIPTAPPTSVHTSKKYNRKVKHKKEIECHE